MLPGRRYTPARDCSTAEYLRQLSDNDVALGVLVQPSFLGTDNSYMLTALTDYPDRLRGIAVVDPQISDRELEAMDATGVVGIRFNMIGKDIDDLARHENRSLMRRVGQLGWQVEVQAHGRDLPRVFEAVKSFDGALVIDHFGLPDPLRGVRDPGFQALLREGPNGRTFVKLSAGYRCFGQDVAACAGALMAVLGPRRLMWGSDWPFTQYEQGRSFTGMIKELVRCVPDIAARDAMDFTAMNLFGFTAGGQMQAARPLRALA
jgi:predicted TIM-barrel fold metal-dependent hydrolase